MSSTPRVPNNTSPPGPLRASKSSYLQPPPNGDHASGNHEVTPKPLAVTGRSRTTPEALNTLWTATVDSPQISERDTIFATSYLSSTPPSSQPNVSRTQISQDEPQEGDDTPVPAAPAGGAVTSEHPSAITPPKSPRPVSILKRPEHRRREKEHSSFKSENESASSDSRSIPTNPINEPMGQATDPLVLPPGFSPIHSPFERPSTPLEKSPRVKFSGDGIDEEERFRYRAWREGKASIDGKLLSGNPRTKPSLLTRVDRKIQATLPKVDPPFAVARSRKTSQYLGLFKEKDAAEELRKQQDRLKEPSIGGATSRRHAVQSAHRQDHGVAVLDFEGAGGRIPLVSSKSQPDIYKRLEPEEQAEQGAHSQHEAQDLPLSKPSRIRTPTDADSALGEELHLSHSVPVGDLALAAAEIAKWRDEKIKSRISQLGAEEDEESEREHISSALYFPHRQIIPEPYSAEDREAAAQASDEGTSPDQAQYPEPQPQAEEQISRSPQEVEISLQSQDDSSCWHGDLRKDSSATEEPDKYSSTGEVPTPSSASEYDSQDDSPSEYGYESSTNDTFDAGVPLRVRRTTQATRKHRHEYSAQNPVGAVQLKPYSHQVGGHSTVYRFSRRAVCKQLNNRENEFYETVERFHPELLEFLPRYIGVLNVTYRKAPKRNRTKDNLLHDIPNVSEFAGLGEHGQDIAAAGQSTTFSRPDDQPRIVSHSQKILPLPEVILENNRHIIPANLFQARPRPSTPSAQLNNPSLLTQLRRADQTPEQPTIAPPSESPDTSPARPAIKQHGSWGATTVNRKLQEQVLREVFTAPPIHRHRRHERSHGVSSRRSRLAPTGGLATAHRSSTDISQLHHAFADLNDNAQEQAHSDQGEHLSMPTPLPAVHDAFAGRSDQAMPDSAGGSRSSSVASRPQRRRHSGGGLRRRPFDIDSGIRTELEFHEEEGYGGDAEEEVFPMDDEPGSDKRTNGSTTLSTPSRSYGPSPATAQTSPPPMQTITPIAQDTRRSQPPPSNPKLSLINQDESERTQLFILLEDLTAGMSKPCVLDLKMGTRQYGVEADEKKQRSQRRKCQMTTSLELGVRVCGMQVWNVKTQSYIFEDKYFGRDLKAGKEFQDALTRFFWDGKGYAAAVKHVPRILEGIAKLEGIIKALPGYRFYASSLLMLYDRGDGTIPPRAEPEAAGEEEEDRDNRPESSSSSSSSSGIKLKIVDFANCVTAEDPLPEGARCPPKDPTGVDRGYLRGLRSLRMYFQRIWNEVNKREQHLERSDMMESMSADRDDSAGYGVMKGAWEEIGNVADDDPGDVST